MSEEVTGRIQRVFRDIFGPTVRFDPLLGRSDEAQWTSLKHVEFIIALEQEFGVRFDGADATDMTSIPSVVERVMTRLR
jgi:acyl carrier protein